MSRGPDRKEVLLISNRRLHENTGRAEKFATRSRLLRERGWNLRVGYVEPSVTGVPVGTWRCIRLARQADVINSVSNPPHLQIAGAITALATDTPWVAEFRDPLVENPDVSPNSYPATVRKWLERYVLTHADRVVWYDGIQIPDDYFTREYPDVPPERYRQLPPIGFEREKFDGIAAMQFDGFTVTYAGSFYKGWIEPYDFLEGWSQFVHGESVTNGQALFYGDWDDDYQQAAREVDVPDSIQPQPFIPHEELVSVLKGSDIVLYIGGDDPRNRLNLPSKLYDYIGAGRPILAIVDPTFRVAEVIREHGFGIVVDPGDPEAVCAALDSVRSGRFEYDPDPSAIDKFTRERSTNAYVETLEEVAG